MPKWIDIGEVKDFPINGRQCVTPGGCNLVVFNVQGAMHAIANSCPHAGLPLQDGDLIGKTLTCPYHGFAFNIESGANADYPNEDPALQTYPVRTTNGRVEVDIEPPTKTTA